MSTIDRLIADAEEEGYDQDGPQPSPSPPTAVASELEQATLDVNSTSTSLECKPAALPWLATLNESQYEAVTAPQDGSMQILAGPGSGEN